MATVHDTLLGDALFPATEKGNNDDKTVQINDNISEYVSEQNKSSNSDIFNHSTPSNNYHYHHDPQQHHNSDNNNSTNNINNNTTNTNTNTTTTTISSIANEKKDSDTENTSIGKKIKMEIFHGVEDTQDPRFINSTSIVNSAGSRLSKASDIVRHQRTFVWTFLTILGLIGGTISFCHDQIIFFIFLGRNQLISHFPNQMIVQMVMWILYNLLFVVFSMLLTHFISPQAEGSGVPQVKAILNGAPLEGPISLRTLIVKVICLPLLLGANLFIGKVGPTIHIGAALANNLMRFHLFSRIRKNDMLRGQMIACGCALGVGANFGTPAGGVLFALEVVGTYYSLRNYLKSFYVALIAAFTSRLLHAATRPTIYVSIIWDVFFKSPSYNIPELFAFAALGVIMGLAGAVFVRLNEMLLMLRDSIGTRKFLFFNIQKWNKNKFLELTENKFLWTLLIATLTSIVTFPLLIGDYFSLPPGRIMEDLFREDLTSANAHGKDWASPNDPYKVIVTLLIFNSIRSVLSTFSISLPIPAGLYIPLLIMGAGWGRLVGEGMKLLFPSGFAGDPLINPAGYAVVGAAALTASTTHAFSTCFILLEIVGVQFHLPTLLAAVISIRVARIFNVSIYDSVIRIKKYPALVEARTDRVNITIKHVMTTNIDFLVIASSVRRIKLILENNPNLHIFPVVYDQRKFLFAGTITRSQLQDLLKRNRKFSDITLIELHPANCPHQLSEETPVLTAHILFSMLGLDVTYVTKLGRLVGRVARQDLAIIQKLKENVVMKAGKALKQRVVSRSDNLDEFDMMSEMRGGDNDGNNNENNNNGEGNQSKNNEDKNNEDKNNQDKNNQDKNNNQDKSNEDQNNESKDNEDKNIGVSKSSNENEGNDKSNQENGKHPELTRDSTLLKLPTIEEQEIKEHFQNEQENSENNQNNNDQDGNNSNLEESRSDDKDNDGDTIVDMSGITDHHPITNQTPPSIIVSSPPDHEDEKSE